jgi:hypothetical protein
MRARFDVAFSLAGEQRSLIEPVAKELSRRGRTVFFYGWARHEAELATPHLDKRLRQVYGTEAGLVVPVLSADYARKPWTGEVEFTVVRELMIQGRTTVMALRSDDAPIEGFSPLHGYVDIRRKSPAEIANLIDLRLNEAAPSERSGLALTRRGPAGYIERLPGTLVAGTLGRFQYWISARRRLAIREVFHESALRTKLFPEMNVPDQLGEKDSPPNARVTIVTGPAGVGKTTYASRLVKALDSTFDVPIVLRGAKLPSSEAAAINVCREIRAYFHDSISIERDTRLPLAAVSHALNRRRVLMVIEDLHHAGPAHEVLRALREYMEQYHRWGPHLRIVATTREPGGLIRQEFGDEAEVISLQPFSQEEARRFFLDLSVRNGMMPGTLASHAEALSRAFTTEAVRTPLFVVICVWLVSATGGGADVESVLAMTASEVFDTFIDHLLRRSAATNDERREFRDFYERLALSLWPQWEDCRLDLVEEQCRQLGAGRAAATVAFIQGNGFMVASRLYGLRLQFPHQSMADYLAACALVRHRRWAELSRESIVGRLKGLAPFLAELIRDDAMLFELAPANFAAFLEVLDARARRGDVLPLRGIVGALRSFARGTVHQPPLAEAFNRIRDLVAGRIAEPWVRELATLLGTLPASPGVIETLAAMGREGEEALQALLLRDSTRHAFIVAAGRPAVRSVLARWLSSPSLAVWRAAAQVFLGCNGPETTDLRAAISQRLGRLELEDISMLRQSVQGTRVLAEAAADAPLEGKQRQAALSVECGKPALIPRGVYEVPIDGKVRKVRINQSFVVPAAAQTLGGPLGSMDAIRQALSRQLGERATLMTEHQARVVYEHFAFFPGRYGVIFAVPGDNSAEVFRGRGREIGLFFTKRSGDSSGEALQPYVSSEAKTVLPERVLYRPVEFVEGMEPLSRGWSR